MTPALRLLATLVLLLPLSVPAKAQLSLFGFNWSMTPLEAMDTLDRDSTARLGEALGQAYAVGFLEEWDVEFKAEMLEKTGDEISPADVAAIYMLEDTIVDNDPALEAITPLIIAIIEMYASGGSLEDISSSKDLDEALTALLEYYTSATTDTNVWFSDGEWLQYTHPKHVGSEPIMWACAGERHYEWALNYEGLEGVFCGEKENGIRNWNPFSEPWIAFNCTYFDGCDLDDTDLADLLFEQSDIEDQLIHIWEYYDYGLCKQVISGERLCVLNSNIILFKAAYQQGQEPAAAITLDDLRKEEIAKEASEKDICDEFGMNSADCVQIFCDVVLCVNGLEERTAEFLSKPVQRQTEIVSELAETACEGWYKNNADCEWAICEYISCTSWMGSIRPTFLVTGEGDEDGLTFFEFFVELIVILVFVLLLVMVFFIPAWIGSLIRFIFR